MTQVGFCHQSQQLWDMGSPQAESSCGNHQKPQSLVISFQAWLALGCHQQSHPEPIVPGFSHKYTSVNGLAHSPPSLLSALRFHGALIYTVHQAESWVSTTWRMSIAPEMGTTFFPLAKARWKSHNSLRMTGRWQPSSRTWSRPYCTLVSTIRVKM